MATPPTAAEPGGRFVLLPIPSDAMVLLIGVAASGKSTFARGHFAPTEILSSDALRAVITDDPHAQAATDDAFFRMFERDKTELRELGVPLETGRNSGFDTTDGYRIARQDYELGEIDLEPDEAAAVALAARLWDTPGLAGAAHGALVKLRAAGVDVDETDALPQFGDPLGGLRGVGDGVRVGHREDGREATGCGGG